MIIFDSGDVSIELPNPDLGDEEDWDTGMTYDRSMNGTLFSHHEPQVTRFNLTFSTMNRPKVIELFDFFKAAMATPGHFNYTDIDTNVHKVTLMTDPVEAVHRKHHRNVLNLQLEVVP